MKSRTVEPRVCVLSSCNHIRTLAHLNHHYYARKHGYVYVFDITPCENEAYFCHAKIQRILKFLPHFDYVLWIDDDALFTNFDFSLSELIRRCPEDDIIVSKSPTVGGRWTYFNAGVMLIRNSEKAWDFLQRVLVADIKSIHANWREDVYGFFTNSDQDVMIALMQDDPVRICRLEPAAMNSRLSDYDVSKPLSQHFIVHFTVSSKQQKIERFARSFSVNSALLPTEYYDSVQPYFFGRKIFPKTFFKRVKSYLASRVNRLILR